MAGWSPQVGVIVVDAASSGAEPGTIHQIDALRGPVPQGIGVHTTHRFGAMEAIELARALGGLPPFLDLFLIEGADFGLGEVLSPPVGVAVRKAVREILQISGLEGE
jgi:hydrogenase maturation protease